MKGTPPPPRTPGNALSGFNPVYIFCNIINSTKGREGREQDKDEEENEELDGDEEGNKDEDGEEDENDRED